MKTSVGGLFGFGIFEGQISEEETCFHLGVSKWTIRGYLLSYFVSTVKKVFIVSKHRRAQTFRLRKDLPQRTTGYMKRGSRIIHHVSPEQPLLKKIYILPTTRP